MVATILGGQLRMYRLNRRQFFDLDSDPLSETASAVSDVTEAASDAVQDATAAANDTLHMTVNTLADTVRMQGEAHAAGLSGLAGRLESIEGHLVNLTQQTANTVADIAAETVNTVADAPDAAADEIETVIDSPPAPPIAKRRGVGRGPAKRR